MAPTYPPCTGFPELRDLMESQDIKSAAKPVVMYLVTHWGNATVSLSRVRHALEARHLK